MMNPDLWKQVDELLEAALEQPAEQREEFVLNACGSNDELREEVMSLIKAQAPGSDFLEHSAMRLAAQAYAHDPNLTTSASLTGKELASYKIGEMLGAGGMGEVYLGRDSKLNRKVALKILPWHFVADKDRVSRFKREAQALSALNHPNLTTIYEVGEANGLHFIAMEFVEGQTLQTLREKLSLKEMLSIVAQVAEALAAAHQAGIVHRDIKPDNIMVRGDGYVKVLDFGLAKLSEVGAAVNQNPGLTQAGVAMGTLAYMSPEQVAGEAIDHRTDVWSLGVVLYEMVTGRKPFVGDSRQATVNAILSTEPNSVTVTNSNAPPELDLIVNRALEKDRELRYQTASDFRADLRRLLRAIDSSPTTSLSRSLSGSVFRGYRKRRVWPIALASLILIAVTVLIWFKVRPSSGTSDWSKADNLQLTNEDGTEYFPSLSPDGKSFVYASREDGDLDLFVRRVGGKNATPLTKNSPANETQPAFSPDGERIAFRSERSPAGIYVMESTGENVRRLTDGGFHPSWSPDGKEIVYSEAGRDQPGVRNTVPSALWIVNVENGARRHLTSVDAMQPAWSPQGNRIAFWMMPPALGRSDVATIPREGGEPVVITTDASTNWNPVWSPDGGFLYFASDRGGNMNFWRVPIDEVTGKALAEPEAVITPSTYSRHLNFSRNGKRMIYVQTDDQSNIMEAGFDEQTEKLTSEPRWITRGDRLAILPEISPDGKRFVMRLSRPNQEDLALVDRDGTNWQDLTNDKYFDRYPRWSPDGTRIVFISDRGGNYQVWVINADGNNLRQITSGAAQAGFPIWAPDSKRLMIRIFPKVMLIDADKRLEEQTPVVLPAVKGPDDRFVPWDWSPDGEKVAGGLNENGKGSIGYYSFKTNSYVSVGNFETQPRWLSDSQRLIFVLDGAVWVTHIGMMKPRKIFTRDREQIRSVGASPDYKSLYFSVRTSESDIWMLDLE